MKKYLVSLVTISIALTLLAEEQKAITQQQVIQMLQLKTPESEIIQEIKKSGTHFTLGKEDVERLKRAGASSTVIAAMQGGAGGGLDLTTAEISDLCLIVDYSGSMSAKTSEGTTKIAAAKEAVGKMIDNLPADLNVGVIVYGVSKQRGCEDIDLIHPLGSVDKAALKTQLLGLKNTGMTPIASSLELAGVALKKAKGGRAIILVTDGVESCKGDPAGVAAKLAAEFGVKFGLHIVGFDIKPEERASLEAIANNGHGKYFNATNASELAAAMQKVTEKVATEPKQRETVGYQASGETVKAGVWFNDAPTLKAGTEYSGTLAMKEAKYYAVPVRKGQEVRAIAIIKKTPLETKIQNTPAIYQDFVVALYDNNMGVVAREETNTKDNPTSPITIRATWTPEADGLAYICVGASANYDSWNRDEGQLDKQPAPSAFTLKIRSEGEGGKPPKVLEVKAGNNHETAGSIPGEGLILTDIKFGESAFYSMPVEKGDVLQVTVAAQKPFQKRTHMAGGPDIVAKYNVVVSDDDQVEVGKKSFEIKQNPPDAASGSWSGPIALKGKANIVVTLDEADKDAAAAGPGRMAILVTKPGGTTSETKSEEESATPKPKDPFSGAEQQPTPP